MAGLREALTELGLNLPAAIAGFWGGIVGAFARQQASLWEIFSSVICGMVAANYLGATVIKYTGMPELPTAFIVGLGGMALCQGIVAAVAAFRFPGKPDAKAP